MKKPKLTLNIPYCDRCGHADTHHTPACHHSFCDCKKFVPEKIKMKIPGCSKCIANCVCHILITKGDSQCVKFHKRIMKHDEKLLSATAPRW